MDPAVVRIGEAMGWLIDRARERQRHLTSAGTIASRAWKPALAGALGSPEALANRLRALDRGEGTEWWTEAPGRPYLAAVAGVLKASPDELTAWIEAARPSNDDDARWFRFEVFPRLRALDLDSDDPYPGVPQLLWRGDGPRGPTWWHAPQGAGRTLVGRWLARRHGWIFTTSLRDAVERTFVEHDADDVPELRLPNRVVIASPHRMPERLRATRWEEIRAESGWELPLLEWAAERLGPGGMFDAKVAAAAHADGRLGASTPGALLEGLAELDALGAELLSDRVHAARALDAWARAHASRADRAVRPASRDWLREHGGWLLARIELERMRRGVAATPHYVLACMPELPTASADAIREARDVGDLDRALALLRPDPGDLVQAMSALRWLLPSEWGLPSRVRAHLRRAVIELALQEEEPRLLGALLDTPDVAVEVVHELAEGARLAKWVERLAPGDAGDPRTALLADGLLKAFALLAAEREASVEDLAHHLAAALLRAYGSPCPDLAIQARVDDAEVWTSIALLTLHRVGVVVDPADDRVAVWAWHAGQALEWREASPGSTRWRLRGLAADTLGALVHADGRWRWSPPPVAALAALAGGGETTSGRWDLGRLGPLEVIERLCAPWAPSIEEVCSLLWPLWSSSGIPHDDSPAKLAKVWATYTGEVVEGRLLSQLVEHAARGVPIPDRLWPFAIATAPGNYELLDRAPIDALLDSGGRWQTFIAPVVWRRAPARALAIIADQVAGEPDWESSPWFAAIPAERALDVLGVLRQSASPTGVLRARAWWADRAIRERVPGWEAIWESVRGGRRDGQAPA